MQPKRISVWVDLMIVVAIFLVATVAGALCLTGLRLSQLELPERVPTLVAYTVQFVLAILGAGLYYRWREGGEGKIFRVPLQWFSAPMTLLGILLIMATSVVLEPLLDLFPERYFDMIGETVGSGLWAILLTVIVAPILEEAFFRGLVLENALRRWPAWRSVLVTAVLFGVVHLPNLPQMVNAVVMGVIMGYIYARTRSLTSVIVIHAVNNAVAYLFLEMSGTQHTDLREVIGNDTLWWIVFGVSAAILTAAILPMALRSERNKKTKKPLHEDNENSQ